jgi:hypothetical protein
MVAPRGIRPPQSRMCSYAPENDNRNYFTRIRRSVLAARPNDQQQCLGPLYPWDPFHIQEWLDPLAFFLSDHWTNGSLNQFKVIPQFCIAHFYCAHLITYNFIHYTYRLKKSFYDNFMLLQTSLVTFVQRITFKKSMFSKKACKSVARVPVSVVYLFTCISRFNATIP